MTVTESTERVGIDRRFAGLIGILGTAAFLAVLDGSAVTASLEPLSAEFGSELAVIVWVTTAYLLAAAAVLPCVGWAIGRFGGRATFVAGLALFVAGSALAGLAWSPVTLILFRVIQGFGGGLLEPTSVTVAAALAPRDHVGRVMGRFSLVINIAPVVGPLIGTLLADNGMWRLIFLINLPLGAVIALIAWRLIPDTKEPDDSSLTPDVIGIGLLSSGFVMTLLAVNRWGAGSVAVAVMAAVAALALLAGYAVRSLRTDLAPPLDLRLLRVPAFAAVLGVMCIVGFVMFTQLSVLPVLASEEFGLQGVARGSITTALGIGLLCSMGAAAAISDRIGPRVLVTFGALVGASGLGVLSFVYDAVPLVAVLGMYVVVGLGFGSVAAPTFSAAYRTLPADKSAQATTALFVAVQLFASTGVTVTGLIVERVGQQQFTLVFAILSGALLSAALLGSALPGRTVAGGVAEV